MFKVQMNCDEFAKFAIFTYFFQQLEVKVFLLPTNIIYHS